MLNLLTTSNGHEDKVWCVSWNPQGTLLASCSGDRTIKIWSSENLNAILSKSSNPNKKNANETLNNSAIKNNLMNELKLSCIATLSDGHTRTVRWISWSPCGKMLASASFDSTIIIWKQKDADTFEIIANLEGHENEVKCTAWSYDGAYLASCSRDRSVWIWDVGDGDDFECNSVLTIHDQDVKHVLWHPHKNLLVSSSYDNSIKFSVQDIDDWSCLAKLTSHDSTVWSCDFNLDGDKLVSASDDKTLKIWKESDDDSVKNNNEIKWKCICTLSGYHNRAIFSTKWSKVFTNLIATACADNSIHIFEENDRDLDESDVKDELTNKYKTSFKLLHHQKNAHTQDCNCVDWHPKIGGLLASCSDDATIKLWYLSDYQNTSN